MGEEKSGNLYELLTSGSKLSKSQETKQIKPIYLFLSWVIIQLTNSAVVWFCWNYAIAGIFQLPLIPFTSSILIYLFVKVLARGFFSPQ